MFIWNRCYEIVIISLNTCRYIKAIRKAKSLHCEIPLASCTPFVCCLWIWIGVGFLLFSTSKSLPFSKLLYSLIQLRKQIFIKSSLFHFWSDLGYFLISLTIDSTSLLLYLGKRVWLGSGKDWKSCLVRSYQFLWFLLQCLASCWQLKLTIGWGIRNFCLAVWELIMTFASYYPSVLFRAGW